MRNLFVLVVTASAVYAATVDIEPHEDTSDMYLILEFSMSGGVRAGQFSGFRRLSKFSGEKIARLHDLTRSGVEHVVQRMMRMENSNDITSAEVTKRVVDIFKDFNEAYAEYTAFHEELRTHSDSFAVSRFELSIIRSYFRKLAKIREAITSPYGPSFAKAVLRREDRASRFVLCKWFKIGFNELSRQVALYLPNTPLGKEISEYPFVTLTFDDHSEACVMMLL